jgi:hypothetical protein
MNYAAETDPGVMVYVQHCIYAGSRILKLMKGV